MFSVKQATKRQKVFQIIRYGSYQPAMMVAHKSCYRKLRTFKNKDPNKKKRYANTQINP